MALPLLLGAAALIPPTRSEGPQSSQAEDPSRIVWLATRAVEGDSAPAMLTRWRQRLTGNGAERAALLGVATLARLSYDYAAADSTYARLLGLSRPDAYTAHAAVGLGQGYRVRGRWPEADSAFMRAVGLAGSPSDARAEALMSLALIRVRMAGVGAAESLLARADSAIPVGAVRLRAFSLCSHAGVMALGGGSGSRAMAEQGAATARQAGEPRLEAACQHIVGQNYWRQGRADSAGMVWGEVAALQRRVHDAAGLTGTLQWDGALKMAVGSYGLALRELREAVELGERSGNLSPVAWALVGLASIHLSVGDYAAGAEFAARATTSFRQQGDQLGIAQARAVEGDLAAARGDSAAARRLYADALALNQRLGLRQAALALSESLADVAVARRDWISATRAMAEAHRVAREVGMPGWEGALAWRDALVAARRGDLASAESLLTVAVSRPEQPVRQYRNLVLLAEVRTRQGRLASADSALAMAAGSLDRWRASLSEPDFRLYAFQLQEDLLDPDLGWATVIAGLAANGREGSAFTLSEGRRARELLDAMGRADALRLPTATANARLDAARRAEPGITARAVAAGLPDERTALIHYVTGRGGEATTAFVITRRGLSAHILAPVDSMSDDVARFVALAEAGTPASGLSRTLGESLLGPVLAELPKGISRLILVPDDVLHRVPFDLLTVNGRLVVEQFAVSLIPSAAVALRLWARPPRDGPARLLAMADPRFPAGGTEGQPAAYRFLFAENGGGLPRLPASATEARTVARYMPPGDVRLRDDASEAFLKHTPLGPYGVLHFATHAFVDERSPARTVLVLAGGDGEDGFVDPGDLAALALDADLVVLSACRTARGVVIRGEGVQGLTAPLLEAGARSVLATTWAVGDRAAARFVEGFYRRLAAGVTVGDALWETKLEEVRAGRPVNQWAAFTLVGDPMVRTATAPAR